eukprot:s148_g7.t1
MEHRGNIFRDTPQAVADRIQFLDPDQSWSIVITAGPPCPDFSRIKGPQGEGRDGAEGKKFDEWLSWLEELLPLLGRRRVLRLVENVVPHRKQDIRHFEQRINKAILFDAANFGRVSRPRLWWTDISWSQHEHTILGRRATWSTQYNTPVLHLDVPKDTQPIGPPTWQPPTCWTKLHKTLPTITTPAEGPEGRPAPRSTKGRMDSATYHRWTNGGKQFAPWHYQAEYMWCDENNILHLPTPDIKEELHHIPPGWTAVRDTDDRARHKAIANAWHVGAAVPPPTPARDPHPLGHTAIEQMAAIWHSAPLLVTQAAASTKQPDMTTLTDKWEHWRLAASQPHPRTTTRELEPELLKTLQLWHHWHKHLPELRGSVTTEMQQLASDLQAQQQIWHKQLKPHIQRLYDPNGPGSIHFPLLQHIATAFGWGDPTLLEEIQHGFRLTGALNPGLGWKARSDSKYSTPTAFNTFLTQNEEYIHHKLATARPDTHWQQLLHEIVEDVRTGRMEGPFLAPPNWTTKTIAAAQYLDMCTLKEGPPRHVPTSVAFSIEQIGSDGQPKIRRGEDWKRSKHNTTVSATDTPNAHRPDTFTAVAEWLHQHNHQAEIWGSDQEAAYRQLAVADPTETYVLLRIPGGWTLWRHTCLLFGSAASVWAYTRTADMLAWIARAALLVPALHYVDDFASLEARTTIQSGFEAAHSTLQTMGFKFKPTKMQPPHHSQRIQGLWMTALVTLLQLLPKMRPMQLNFRTEPTSVIYADAYFKAGERTIRLSAAADDWSWNPDGSNIMENGWGFIIRHNTEVFFAHGSIPPHLMSHFTTRRAFIYALEVLAQTLALIAGQNFLYRNIWCFCDNEAGRCALMKGFGRDVKLNSLLSCVWQFLEAKQLAPHFQRVTSEANMSDAISRHQVQEALDLGWKEIEMDWDTMEQKRVLNDEDRNHDVLREGGAEAARDFIQAMPGSTPTRKSVKMDAQEARSVARGYVQETSPSGNDQAGAGSQLWNRARSALAASSGAGAEDRRNWRRELRLERAHRKRLEREMATLRNELAKCESIVEQLVEEIEEQTRSKGGSASSSLLEGKSHIAGKQKSRDRVEGPVPGDTSVDYVDDLKGALSGFFSAIGTRVTLAVAPSQETSDRTVSGSASVGFLSCDRPPSGSGWKIGQGQRQMCLSLKRGYDLSPSCCTLFASNPHPAHQEPSEPCSPATSQPSPRSRLHPPS